jgi:hypothetical protein
MRTPNGYSARDQGSNVGCSLRTRLRVRSQRSAISSIVARNPYGLACECPQRLRLCPSGRTITQRGEFSSDGSDWRKLSVVTNPDEHLVIMRNRERSLRSPRRVERKPMKFWGEHVSRLRLFRRHRRSTHRIQSVPQPGLSRARTDSPVP